VRPSRAQLNERSGAIYQQREGNIVLVFHRRLLRLVVPSLAFATVPVSALADHAWGSYHWARTANPFTVALGDNVSSAWDSYLSQASVDWTVSEAFNTTVVAGGTRSDPRRCRATNGRVEVCNYRYGSNGWLGIAQIWISGSHITQSIVKLNDTYFNTARYNTPAWRRFVMCQEVGHAFGLDHQDENFSGANLGSCMDYTSDPDGPPSNEHPNPHDYDQLEAIYSHFDGTNSAGQAINGANMPPAMKHIDFAEPAQWGRLARSKKGGRAQLYELDFGRGHKVFTHVLWVEGSAHEDEHAPR
jgi:hypothetical protein